MKAVDAQAAAKRVLVAEDNLLIADTITEVLEAAGFGVVGPVPSLRDGLELASRTDLAGAVLDIKLSDGQCFAIATILRLRQIPFVFLTGYDPAERVPQTFRSHRALVKPHGIWELADVLNTGLTPH